VNSDIQDFAFPVGDTPRHNKACNPAIHGGDMAVEPEVVVGLPLRGFGGGRLDSADLIEIGWMRGAHVNSRGKQIVQQLALLYSDRPPAEIALDVITAGRGNSFPEIAIGQQRFDPFRKIFRRVRDPNIDAMTQTESRASAKSGNHGALHGHGFQHLQVRAGGNQSGNNGEVRFGIEWTDVGDELPRLARLVSSGRLSLADTISAISDLDGAQEALERLRRGEGARTVLVIDRELAQAPDTLP